MDFSHGTLRHSIPKDDHVSFHIFEMDYKCLYLFISLHRPKHMNVVYCFRCLVPMHSAIISFSQSLFDLLYPFLFSSLGYSLSTWINLDMRFDLVHLVS